MGAVTTLPNVPSFLKPLLQQYAQQQQEPDAQPDISAVPYSPGAAQAEQDISQSMTQGQQAPNLRSTFLTADNGAAPRMTKGGKLMSILMSGIQGGLNGLAGNAQTYAQTGRNAGFGGGFQGAQMLPIERQMMQGQAQRIGLENQQLVQMLPFLRAQTIAGLRKTQSEIDKNTSEAGKFGAETAGMPIKQQLEQAQTLAAYFKDDPASGQLIDLRTQQPVNAQGLSPLTDQEAVILGKQPGGRVPLKIKNTASEMVNRGIHTVQANGRSLLVDNQGNTIKDLGAATPMAVINAQMNTPQQITPEMQAAVDMVGQGKVDLPTALSNYRRFPGQSQAFLGALHDKYPDYFQGSYGSSKKVLEYFTSGQGATNLNAFNTATDHLRQLANLGANLQNTGTPAFNAIKNQIETWSGGPAPNNFDTVKMAVVGEVGKTFKGVVTEGEIDRIEKRINSAQSPQQMAGFIEEALSLMRSKVQANAEQFTQGMQGKPAFPNMQGQGFSVSYGGKTYTFKDQKSLDGFKKEVGIQ